MLASTVKSRPRNLLIVRALAGDSTITSDLPFFAVFLAISYHSFPAHRAALQAAGTPLRERQEGERPVNNISLS